MDSPYIAAWSIILSNRSDLCSLEVLRALFPDKEGYSEEYGFLRLHSVVLRLCPGRLEEVLAESNIDINATDNRRRTALSWAVQRRDHNPTKLLLPHRADPEVASIWGTTPIAIASHVHNLTGIRLLLEFGASATHKGRDRRNCLHWICYNISQKDILEDLIAAGCNVHDEDRHGSTPLSVAAAFSNISTISTLMNHGSDINTIDSEGDSPLVDSIFYQKDGNTRFLLEHGANYTTINNYGQSILHHAVLYGSLTTLEILRSAKLSRIDPNAKNKKNKTALQLAQERHTKPEGFINLLLTPLFEIRCRNDALAWNGGQSEDAESVEAHVPSKITEAGGDERSPTEGASEASNANAGKVVGAAGLERIEGENDGESGDTFFDALEQQ